MSFIEGRKRFQSATRREVFFAILAAVSMMLAILLLPFPAGAQTTSADLSITKQGPARVEPLDQFDYILTVNNAAGAQPASNVTVEDQLPPGVAFEEFEAPGGVACADADGTVTCTVPNLAAGESKTITLTVRAPLDAGVIENKATASAAEDPDSPVASNRVATTVAPRLIIKKLADPDPVRTDGILAYTIRVENPSATTVNGVTVRDELPLDLVDFSSVDSGDFDCEYKAGIIRCSNGVLGPHETGKVEIVVKPEKAGTIQNTADVFVEGVGDPIATDTETTTVTGGGSNPDNPNEPNEPNEPTGPDVPQGDQCSPVVNLDTGDPLEVISGTDPVEGTFKNFYNDTLPLRIAYATSSEDGSLTITLTRKDNGKTILDEKINGKKRGVLEVDTDAGVTYDIAIVPDNQGYAVDLQIGTGTDEPCTNPDDLKPPTGPDGNDGTNDNNGANDDNGADDVIDETISDNPLPDTGGPSLLGIAVVTFGLAVSGVSVVTVRRRDR